MMGKDTLKKYSYIKKNMKDYKSYIYVIVIFILIFSSAMLIGFALIIWKTYFHTDQTPQFTYNLFLTIGMGVFSIGIAFISIKIASESDDKINNISNTNFLSVLSRFEDRRLDLQYHQQRARIHPILIWKALVDMREAEELLEFCNIEIKHQTRFINLLNHLLKFVNREYIEVLNCEEVSHLIQMGLIGLKLDDKLTDKKNEALSRAVTLFDDEQNIEIPENYLNWMKNAIEEELFRDNFFLMRDQYKEWYWSTINHQ